MIHVMVTSVFLLCGSKDPVLIEMLNNLFVSLDGVLTSEQKIEIKSDAMSIRNGNAGPAFLREYSSSRWSELDKKVGSTFPIPREDREFLVFRLYRGHITSDRFDLKAALRKGREYGFPPKPRKKVSLPKPVVIPEE